jgi:sodium-dependent phosphate cotransporter
MEDALVRPENERLAVNKPSPEGQIKLELGPIDLIYRLVGLIIVLYFFLVGIDLIGSGFKLVGGASAGGLFGAISNPLISLMVGMAATALLQSSSTTTSIVVGLVAGGAITVPDAIPMIMGANIGTSVTNTLVSMGHAGNRDEMRRAFAGATVHDFFNLLSVLVLLPLEVAFGFIEKASGVLTGLLAGGGGADFDSPLKAIISPISKAIISVDKSKIKEAAAGVEIDGSLLKGGVFVNSGLSDQIVGITVVIGGGMLTIIALLMIVKLMKSMMEARASQWLTAALEKNAYASMLIGAGATVTVQSSSITTSAMVPMIGVGLVTLEAVFPLTLGANLGTTVTALLASMASTGSSAALGLQIAICHLLFNILGILIWYPLPFMRRVPLSMARRLGDVVSDHRWVAPVYVLVVFFVIPLSLIALTS